MYIDFVWWRAVFGVCEIRKSRNCIIKTQFMPKETVFRKVSTCSPVDLTLQTDVFITEEKTDGVDATRHRF